MNRSDDGSKPDYRGAAGELSAILDEIIAEENRIIAGIRAAILNGDSARALTLLDRLEKGDAVDVAGELR